MDKRKRHKYNDQWILEHYDPDARWSAICKQYNETFGTDIKYPTFVSHMNRELGLQQDFRYTKEQDDFLKARYSFLGYLETTRLFNDKFGTKRSAKAIQHRCKDVLGVSIGKERKVQSGKENNYKTQPVGTISSGLYGTPAIKTEDGWVRLDRVMTGVNKGGNQVIVHIDGNKNNNDPDNLFIASRSTLGRMLKNEFWSDNPTITKTGLICCELEELLNKEGIERQ